MKAFHSKQEIKDKYIERVKQHMEADEIIKGIYWKNGKGCAVGCTIHGDDHSKYQKKLGIPIILARLEDNIFERLPNKLAKTWPLRFLESIEVGSDLSTVWSKFSIYLLIDKSQCNLRHPICKIVAYCLQRQLDGEIIDWDQIRKSAVNCAFYDSNAFYIDHDADLAASNIASNIASDYASYSTKSIISQSEKLLELLKECK